MFLKVYRNKGMVTTALLGDREDKGGKLIFMLFTPPHPSRKEAEPT